VVVVVGAGVLVDGGVLVLELPLDTGVLGLEVGELRLPVPDGLLLYPP
jgi:hypothetical protein